VGAPTAKAAHLRVTFTLILCSPATAVIITQRSQVQILPALPPHRAFIDTMNALTAVRGPSAAPGGGRSVRRVL